MEVSSLHSLLRRCAGADTLEVAAQALVESMAVAVGPAVDASPYARQLRLLRGMVHLRPEGGYRGLVVHELAREDADLDAEALRPSTTAFGLVQRSGLAVEVDVHTGVLRPIGGGADERFDTGASGSAFQSAAQLAGRQTSHLVALPLRQVDGRLWGMVSLEVSCLPAVGKPFVWADCQSHLQLLVDVAAPYLCALPLAEARTEVDPLLPVIGERMRGVVRLLRVFSRQQECILVRGPTGAGKSRLARWIHAHSSRSEGPFEAVDLLTLTEDMQLPTLFGWTRGAFTGAAKDTPGCVARAQGGTLFLDEIDKLSLNAQAGLLQLLEERSYRVMGDAGGLKQADVRFVVGSNADLEGAVREGRFREDLFFRINVLPVHLPAVDERRDEIPGWSAFMLRRHDESSGGTGPAQLGPGTAVQLQRRSWPGNLRQLDNVIRRAYAMALADFEDGAAPSGLMPSHVEQALAFEAAPGSRDGLVASLGQAARAFAQAAQAAQARGETLELELSEAFRGFVLLAGEAATGSREAACELYGKGALVQNRNHHKVFKRELARIAALCAASGEAPPPELES